jgi:flagellar biosynthesis protein FlhA
MMNNLLVLLKRESSNLFFILAVLGIMVILFTPVPSWLLDILLLANFSFAILILMLTLDIDKPLSFSTFPSLLLITTLFRLALNISSTRLILENGDAGKVIDAVGEHIVSGSYIIGFVIFSILIVVQYIVITNGAQRVAEVAARFTLDSLPGKQMSIDADLNMGAIDQETAAKRRQQLERESNFYGAMDGASKFVKGDAIAGIIIIFINIIGGLSIGVFEHGMEWGAALHTYTLLTVGDGIITQIPALIIAVAAGIIITRAATDAKLGQEFINQMLAHPQVLIAVGFIIILLMLFPGLPAIPLAMMAAIFLGSGGWIFYRAKSKSTSSEVNYDEIKNQEVDNKLSTNFELRIGSQVDAFVNSKTSLFTQRIETLQRQIRQDMGLITPKINLHKDQKLIANDYMIFLNGAILARGEVFFGQVLAIKADASSAIVLDGKQTIEPTYGLPAVWIDPEQRTFAKSLGYTIVEPEIVLVTHISEILKRSAADFLTRAQTEYLIESRRGDLGSLVEELVPNILSYSDIQRVLQLLLQEQISIRYLDQILEVLVDTGRHTKDVEELTEKVRQSLGSILYDRFLDTSGRLNVITIDPALEGQMLQRSHPESGWSGLLTSMQLDEFINVLSQQVEKVLSSNIQPILLCSPNLRRALKSMLSRAIPHLSILSISELGKYVQVSSAGFVKIGKSLND